MEKAGKYRFELRRWPNEIEKSFNDSLPEGEQVPGGNPYPKGVALEYVKAKIQIDDVKDSTIVRPEEHFVSFTFDLKEGEKKLQTWFTDTAGIEWGAYYVYVESLDK